MLCHECGSDEHLIAKCPRKNSSVHFANNQEIITPNGVMHYATPAYVHAGATQTSVPHGSTGDSGLQAASHEQPARTTEMNEDPSITGDYDPSFQLILRRHGPIAMPRDVDPDHEWTEIQEFDDTSISRPSSLLHDLDYDQSHSTVSVMYASPVHVQSIVASSTSGPASSTCLLYTSPSPRD